MSTTETTPRAGNWMQTYTGRAFFPLDPRVDDIDIVDIAHGLSMQCRYNGHVDRFYSVAEHCVLMADYFLAEMVAERIWADEAHHLALWALLHDAAEAYIGDMVRPLKLHMPDFRAADDNITAVIATRFGLRGSVIPSEVRNVDTRILLDERAELLVPAPRAWTIEGMEPLGVEIQAWSPAEAKAQYLSRFGELAEMGGVR